MLSRISSTVDGKLRGTRSRPGESISSHGGALRGIIENSQNIPGIITLVHFNRAFTSINHNYLGATLLHYGVTPYLTRAIMSLYSSSTIQVLIPQGLTEKIPVCAKETS